MKKEFVNIPVGQPEIAQPKSLAKQLFHPLIVIAALGYFVDIYDLLLFSIVRVSSLRSLGLSGNELLESGIFLINIQMAGLVIGGVLWGIMGDKMGRLSVLFGSILLYSLANIANGFANTLPQYAVCRIIAGIGLAGELGAGITLVAEILPKEIRGYGTTLVASVGLLGAVLAFFIAKTFDWQIAYWIGGGLGLSLLILRISVAESGIFTKLKENNTVQRGNIGSLFKKPLFKKYLRCILIGLPIWYVIGILITFSPEFYAATGTVDGADAGQAVMWCYIGLAMGDLSSGLLSQYLRSRKKVLLIFIILTAVSITIYLSPFEKNLSQFYFICFLLGVSIGYWALFVTIAAEQFGTNIRSTAATTIPNFVRGAIIPLTFMFDMIRSRTNLIMSGWIVGVITILIALLALYKLEETFGKDLDFIES